MFKDCYMVSSSSNNSIMTSTIATYWTRHSRDFSTRLRKWWLFQARRTESNAMVRPQAIMEPLSAMFVCLWRKCWLQVHEGSRACLPCESPGSDNVRKCGGRKPGVDSLCICLRNSRCLQHSPLLDATYVSGGWDIKCRLVCLLAFYVFQYNYC